MNPVRNLNSIILQIKGVVSNGVNLTPVRKWIEEDKLYLWIVIVIILFNTTFSILNAFLVPVAQKEAALQREILLQEQSQTMAALRNNIWFQLFFGVGTLIALILFILGLFSAAHFLRKRFRGEPIAPWRLPEQRVLWTIRDVFHVVVLLVLFSYFVEFVQVFIVYFIHGKISENLRVLSSTLITDVMVFYLIFRLVKVEKGQTLSHLGLSTNAFFQNLLFGLRGYLSLLPGLFALLLLSLWLAEFFQLSPPAQPLYDLFTKESSRRMYIVGLLLVVFLGPVIEELFFRGFLYNALKARWGKGWAILSSGVLFAALHANLIAFLPISLLGCALAYGYELTGSLVASMTIHILHNFLVMVVFLMTHHFSQFSGVL